MTRIPWRALPALLLLAGMAAGCATLREVAALRKVVFGLSGVSDVRLAGIPLDRVNAYADLGAVDLARLATAITRREVPLDMVVHVRAENPQANDVSARLTALDWTLFVRDRETLSGRQAGSFELPPGRPVDVPVATRFELTRFFGAGARDLVDLALGLAGHGALEVPLRLELTPTIDTPLGPMRYPAPITVTRGS